MKLEVLKQDENNVITYKFRPDSVIDEPLIQVTVIPSIGDFVKYQDPLITIETCSRLFSLRSPLEGMLSSLNSELFHMMDRFDFNDWVVSLRQLNYEEWSKLKVSKSKVLKKKSIPSPQHTLSIHDYVEEIMNNRANSFYNTREFLPTNAGSLTGTVSVGNNALTREGLTQSFVQVLRGNTE